MLRQLLIPAALGIGMAACLPQVPKSPDKNDLEVKNVNTSKGMPLERACVPSGVELVEGGLGEALMLTTSKAATLIAPIFPTQGLTADFFWANRRQRLIVDWPEDDEAPGMHFEDPVEGDARSFTPNTEAERLCECHVEVYGEGICEVEQGWPTGECTPTCANVYGNALPECFEAYGERCPDLLRCARGE